MTRCGFWILTLALGACGGDEDKDKNTGDDTDIPEVVDVDGDGSPVEEDCDDTDPNVYPAAPELCDQRANDCDTMDDWSEADEAGTAMFTDSDGNMSDFTGSMAGAEDAPASVTVSEAGQIDLCEGTFYAALEVSADLDLVSHGEVALSGAGQATILTVLAEGITVKASSLTMQDGLATVVADITDEYQGTAGGAVNADVSATVELQDVMLKGNSGEYAGAIFAGNGAAINGIDITAEGNSSDLGSKIAVASYGARLDLENLISAETGGLGIYGFESFISLSGAEMQEHSMAVYAVGSNGDVSQSNFSGNEVGLVFESSDRYYSTVEVTESSFSSNETAILQRGGLLTITDSDFTENSGESVAGVSLEGVNLTVTDSRFIDNVSTESWPALYLFVGSAEISGCEFTGNQTDVSFSAAYLYAGTLEVDNTVTVSDTSFSDNIGGGLHISSSSVTTLTGLTFTGNQVNDTLRIERTAAFSASDLVFEENEGTAIAFHEAVGEVNGVSIIDQDAEYYAGLELRWGSTVSVDDIDISSVSGSEADLINIDGESTEYYDESSLTLSNATLSGGGIYISGDAVLNNVIIDEAIEYGIRISTSLTDADPSLTATDLTVSNAGQSCMWVYDSDTGSAAIVLENTVFDTCADTGVKLYGGAGFTATEFEIRNSTGPYTGGIYLSEASEVTLIDSTIEGNSTDSASYAGGVAVAGELSSILLDNVDFIDNFSVDTPADLTHSWGSYEVLGLGYSGFCSNGEGCTTE